MRRRRSFRRSFRRGRVRRRFGRRRVYTRRRRGRGARALRIGYRM